NFGMAHYDPKHDEQYLAAMDIHLRIALTDQAPDASLRNLKSLAKWFDRAGDSRTANEICRMICSAAPGNFYAGEWTRRIIRDAPPARSAAGTTHAPPECVAWKGEKLRAGLVRIRQRVSREVTERLRTVFGAC